MNSIAAIQLDNVSKKYCRSIRQSIRYGISDIARNTLGLSTYSQQLRPGEFWAVRDVSFNLQKGRALGIIGPNGSGKSTLLKMLGGIFWPDQGNVTINGRVGSLIEVGAGFHPLLTGRENIYVNAAILGMTKEETDARLQDIVAFADIGQFIDSPVKYYSSGMYVRLGFAIAVHCQPDILLVDEILAVGDANFRNKCYQKIMGMQKLGITIVIVSHDLFSIEKICQQGLLLQAGKIVSQGDIRSVISDYQKLILDIQETESHSPVNKEYTKNSNANLVDISILDAHGQPIAGLERNHPLRIVINYRATSLIGSPQIEISLINQDGVKVSSFDTLADHVILAPTKIGINQIECWVDPLPLLTNIYWINVHLYDTSHTQLLDYWSGESRSALRFQVLPDLVSAHMGGYAAICHFPVKWISPTE